MFYTTSLHSATGNIPVNLIIMTPKQICKFLFLWNRKDSMHAFYGHKINLYRNLCYIET